MHGTDTTTDTLTATPIGGPAAAAREPFRMMGIAIRPLAEGPDTGGAWEVVEQHVSPGAGSPLHRIAADKLFYVADGELHLVRGTDTVVAPAGTSLVVPAGTPHRFLNASERPARLVVVTSGAGHVAFLRELSAEAVDGPPERDRMVAVGARHGVSFD